VLLLQFLLYFVTVELFRLFSWLSIIFLGKLDELLKLKTCFVQVFDLFMVIMHKAVQKLRYLCIVMNVNLTKRLIYDKIEECRNLTGSRFRVIIWQSCEKYFDAKVKPVHPN